MTTIPGPSKIATCCYCGTRAALVLRGQERHELSCSNCGAPLHDLKMIPRRRIAEPTRRTQTRAASAPKKSRKRKKGLFYRVLDEAWDVLEDVFD